MSAITSRLHKVLQILLEKQSPVTVAVLAEELNVSRRTVFRELEKAEPFLSPYALELVTMPGEGLALTGREADRNDLQADLDAAIQAEPSGKRERHLRLLLHLLRETEQHKLFAYADTFKVSVATISHDLDEIRPRLNKFSLELSRRQGYGVTVEGKESARRRAILDILRQLESENCAGLDFPTPEILHAIHTCGDMLGELTTWMTPLSRKALARYMMTAAQRVADGHPLPQSNSSKEYLPLAQELAQLMEQHLSFLLPEVEKDALSLQLAACRRNTDAQNPDGNDNAFLSMLAGRMIESFDADMAPLLKMDEPLVNGLVAHLRSAVIRLEEQVWIDDPLEGELARNYPDLVRKTRKAASILETVDQWIPDSEISFLAAHFGAAMLRLSGRSMRKKTVRSVIVCINGIGTSHLLAAQIKRHFGNELEVEVGGWSDFEEWKNFDFLISTTPVKRAAVPVIVVPPILDEAAIQRIRDEMELRAWVVRSSQQAGQTITGTPLTEQCLYIEQIASDARNLLDGFSIIHAPDNSTLTQLATLAGQNFTDFPDQAEKVTAALLNRERLSTQVIPELGIILLHSRADAVTRPTLGLIMPTGGNFTQKNLQEISSCMVMLMPRSSLSGSLEMMGHVSSLLLEDPQFLKAVQEGDKASFLRLLEDMLRSCLMEFMTQKLKG